MRPREFGAWIKDLRLALPRLRPDEPVSANEVARRANISGNTLSYIEHGRRIPKDRGILERLADVLGVSRSEMLQRAGYSPSPPLVPLTADPWDQFRAGVYALDLPPDLTDAMLLMAARLLQQTVLPVVKRAVAMLDRGEVLVQSDVPVAARFANQTAVENVVMLVGEDDRRRANMPS